MKIDKKVTIMQTKTNGNGHATKTRKSWKTVADLRPDSLALALLKAPSAVADAQRSADTWRLEFEGHVAAVSVRALSEPIFRVKGKGDEEDSWRVAANDQERKLAIDEELHLDSTYVELRDKYEAGRRELQLAKDRLRALMLAAKLVLKDS